MLAFACYLLVSFVMTAQFSGSPGGWSFAWAQMLALPVPLYALFSLGSLRLRASGRAISDAAAVSAAVFLALLAIWTARPGIGGDITYLPAGLLAVIAFALAEESMFRGVLLPVLAGRFGLLGGVLASAALFGALHWQSGASAALGAFLAGLALGGLYLRNGLGCCVVFHAAFSVMAGPVAGLSLGGAAWPGLLDPIEAGDPLANGLVQLGLLILALWWLPRGIIRGKSAN